MTSLNKHEKFNCLTPDDIEHLQAQNMATIEEMEYVFKMQVEWRKSRVFPGEPCHACKSIAEKLGYEV